MQKFAAFVLASAAMGLASPSAAALVNAPVPTNAYITFNGLDWAWASPLPAGFVTDLSFQGTQGWRSPTAVELAGAPLATQFLFAGANVPFSGVDPVSGATFSSLNANYLAAQSAGACAAPYFSFVPNCDWFDGAGQDFGPWAGPGALLTAEQLFVRVAQAGAVPEPGTWAMMLLGLGLAGTVFRRNRKGARPRLA